MLFHPVFKPKIELNDAVMLQKYLLAKVTKNLFYIDDVFDSEACNFLGNASLLFTGSIRHHIGPYACFELPIAYQIMKDLA